MDNFKGKLYNVHSGNISKVGWEWDEENKFGVLRVEFNNQMVYDYWPVDKKKYDEFWQSDSRGKWFDSEIKKNLSINYEKVE